MNRRSNPLPRGIEAFLPPADPAPPGPGAPIPIDHLEPNPFQPRRLLTGLDDLAASIAEHGILQPILARPHPQTPGRYQIIAGERRWRAAQQSGLHEVPVVLHDLDDREAAIAALVENLQREDLNAMDEAEGYARMVRDFGWTQETLARAVGRSRSHVANTLRLLGLPASAAAAIRAGEITAGHGRAILAHPEPELALRRMLARDLSVRQAEQLARETPKAALPRDPDRDAVSQQLIEALGLRVSIDGAGERGTLKIRFNSFDQLDGLVRLLMPG